MHIPDFDRRRSDDLRGRILGGRASVQIVVGALAIAAIVLAFAFRPGQGTEEIKPAAAAGAPASTAGPTATLAAAATIPAPTPAPTNTKERIHVVVSGDTLTSIADQYYGDASRYLKIYEANTDILSSPNSLQIGQKLKIPE